MCVCVCVRREKKGKKEKKLRKKKKIMKKLKEGSLKGDDVGVAKSLEVLQLQF